VFKFVADKTGDKVRAPQDPPLGRTQLNKSYPGIFNRAKKAPLPIPNTTLVDNGRTVLPKIVQMWGSPQLQKCTLYTGKVEVPSGANPPVLPSGC
jgi:acid phosphatase